MGAADIAMEFATRLNRHRALTSEESAMLASLLCKIPTRRTRGVWGPADDRRLRRMAAKTGFRWDDIGAALGCTAQAAQKRMKRLRQRDRAKMIERGE